MWEWNGYISSGKSGTMFCEVPVVTSCVGKQELWDEIPLVDACRTVTTRTAVQIWATEVKHNNNIKL